MSLAFRCEVCDGPPMWTLLRIGDVVVSWSCAAHLSEVAEAMQRHFEVTQLRVTPHAKAVEVAEINDSLARIAREADRAGGSHDGL